MHQMSDELRTMTNQLIDEESNSSHEPEESDKDEKKEERRQAKPNTQIKVVVPMCTDVADSPHKAHPRRKHVKKPTSRGKKHGDESLEALTKKYGSKHRHGKKMVILDPIKYLQELEKGEHKTESNKEEKTPPIKKSTPPPVPPRQNTERESESQCYHGHEVMLQKHKSARQEYTCREQKDSTSMALPKIGHFGITDNETCSMNLPGRKITCENCKARAMNELEFTLSKHPGDTSPVSREHVHTSRTVHRHCCAKSSKPILYYHCSSETSGKSLPAYISQTLLHNRRILTCNPRTHMKSEQHTFEKPVSNLGFHPERYTCPKSAAYCCMDEFKRKQTTECFTHREILRPNKVTIQSPGLPTLIASDCLPLEEISIGFRFRIGKKAMYRIPLAFEPEETGNSKVHHYESPKRIVPRAKTFYGQYRA